MTLKEKRIGRGRRIVAARDRILEVAYHEFAKKGYTRASMADIADKIGVTRPALYYHFPSKEDLFLAVYDTIDPLVNVDVSAIRACDNAASYRAEFRKLISDIIANFHSDEERARFVGAVESSASQVPSVLDRAKAQHKAMFDTFLSAIEQGAAVGLLADGTDLNSVADYLCIFIYGVSDAFLRGTPIDTDQILPLLENGIFK